MAERRLLFELRDIKGVTFRCSKCGARISVSPRDTDLPQGCPADHRWDIYTTAGQFVPAARVVRGLSDTLALEGDTGFTIFLEFDEPPRP